MNSGIKVCVFDVNETLLSLTPLEHHFASWFHDPDIMREWFAQLVLYSQSLTLCGRYIDFGELSAAVLDMIAQVHSSVLPKDAGEKLKSTILALPPHDDVKPALRHLRDAGVRLVTLTNSGADTQRRQLDHARIAELFETQFSVETVRAFKPARSTYESVAAALNVSPAEMVLVACHSWDTIGAKEAAYQTAFIRRPGNAQLPFGDMQATYACESLTDFADQIAT